MKGFITGFVAAICCVFAANAQHQLTVKVNEANADIQPTMWGVFFEDINFGADGGIYAELVKNRSFEFFKPLMGWTIQQPGRNNDQLAALNPPVLVVNRKENNTANPRFIRVTVNNKAKGELGLTNEGFRGMGIKKDLRYDFSIMYHQDNAGVKIHVELVDSTGKFLGGTTVAPDKTGISWHKFAASFTATAGHR